MNDGSREMEVRLQKPREFTVTETHGELFYMVTWQSLDGRPMVEYYETFEEASQKCARLFKLGRTPKLWGELGQKAQG